ncbi:hypothetical protein [Chromobacterium sp. IIBBL 290-4]|uniref:hypothetical protein n=1 Tax=Chromobacterium sp. IIBBL 290-4 TaxID=2953890 RepID=UPI0020B87785|nr:hypothetical protein [Chromobacterium sp. IIBBL 290-4]UTH72380.1 hypothetical protein NKT35_12520 [Chromobacterium sp. IIBBL 290-4]
MRAARFALIALLWASSIFANCVNLNGRSYCAPPGGQALVHQGQAYCGVGACRGDAFGNVFCSPYPGGDVIFAKGSFYAGRGLCLLAGDGSAQCSAQPGGNCALANGNVVCDGGNMAEPAVRAGFCQ